MKRLIFLIVAILAAALFTGAYADPARTDGTVTAWIGEGNELFLHCSDNVTRKLSTPMKDILRITETDIIGLTQNNQIVSVKKDGTGYSILSTNASDAEIAAQADTVFELKDGILTLNGTVVSERAAAAVSDGLILYWINKGDNGYVLMQKEIPGKEQESFGRIPVSLTGISVPEPAYLCVTAEALTLTASDRSIAAYSLKTGETKLFPASGQDTKGACLADDRLYRYQSSDLIPWILETIQNDAMQLTTVTPEPTSAATPTPTPAVTATPTPQMTSAPASSSSSSSSSSSGSSSKSDDGNIHKGAKGSEVRKIQRRLKDLGYPVGNVDGDYGDQTQIAVALFYDAIHQQECSYVTTSMYQRLFASDAPAYDMYMPLQKGDHGMNVRYMQMMLQKNGYDPGEADGIYGEQTIKAVAQFQIDIGYEPQGREVPGEYASRELMQNLLGPTTVPITTNVSTDTDL